MRQEKGKKGGGNAGKLSLGEAWSEVQNLSRWGGTEPLPLSMLGGERRAKKGEKSREKITEGSVTGRKQREIHSGSGK